MGDKTYPSLDICAPKTHRRWVPRMQPQLKIKDFRPGTPIYPVPIGFNAFLFGGGGGLYSHVRGRNQIKFYSPHSHIKGRNFNI